MAFAVAAALCIALPASAGTIGFRTDVELKTGPGLDAKVTLTHTGDEAAADVRVKAEFEGHTVEGEIVPSVDPGKDRVWNFHLADELPRGQYAVVLRVSYADANGYPFEIVSTASAPVGVTAAPRLFGSFDASGLTVGGQTTGRFTIKRPPQRSGTFDLRIVAPSGLSVTPDRVPLTFDDKGKAVAEFQVRNLKLLAGTSVNVFALLSGEDPGFPQVDIVRGTVRIGSAVTPLRPPLFYRTAMALLALLVVLELGAWMTGRREQA